MNWMNKNKREHDSTLIVMVGISGSGKSTKAEELATLYKATIYSSDKLREELYGDVNDQTHNEELFLELHKRMVNDLKKGKSVIYDATNLSLKNRKKFETYMEQKECYPAHVYAYVMSTPFAKCVERNKNRDRQVPDYVLEKQVKSFEIPFYDEGFDEIYIDGWCEPTNYFKFKKMRDYILFNKKQILSNMEGVDQMSKYHKYTLDIHSTICSNYAKCPDSTWTRILKEASDFHDIGKLYTRTQKKDGNCSYLNHANVGAYYMLSHIDAIDLNEWKEFISCLTIINYHMRPFDWNSERTQKKYFNIFGPILYTYLTFFNICDKRACGTENDIGGDINE